MVKEGVPKQLEERLLIDAEDRELLKIIEELSPHDTGRILVTPSIFENYIPSVSKIADKVGKTEKEVWKQMVKIGKIWGMPSPKEMPTNNGHFSEEEAFTNALVNQHKLRWDEGFGNYRVPKLHMFSAEMGTGTLYTNNDAFLGEKIIRQSLNLDEQITSYHMQGGIMPDMVTMFGKAKNKRAIMTGLNKANGGVNGDELELIVQELELLNRELERDIPLTKKEVNNLEKWVVNTIDSREEAAESVAYEISPLLENLPEHTPIHMYFSYNDDYNLSELEDQHIAIMRDIHKRMDDAVKQLPNLRNNRDTIREELVESKIENELTNRYFDYLIEQRNKFEEPEEFPDKGKEFRDYREGFFEINGKKRKSLDKTLRDKLKASSKKILGREFEIFDSKFNDVWNSFYEEHTTMKKVEDKRKISNNRLEKMEKNLSKVERQIHEAEAFENSLLVEKTEGYSWFTKKIAMKPTEAKALETLKKQIYKDLYNEIMIPKIKELTGKNLDIKLHTDDIITVHVPDPEHIIKYGGDDIEKKNPKLPIGTLMTSFPRTNSQRSNEPLKESFVELIRFHEGEISEAIKKNKKRPEKMGDFNKRDFAHTDIGFSGYGADGYRSQRKFSIDPTTVFGEYAGDNHIVTYIKLPTRHDTQKFGELMVKGNKGTWGGKRIAKGGNTTGPVLLIEHPDRSNEQLFLDDDNLKRVAEEFGGEYLDIENGIKELRTKYEEARTKKEKNLHQKNIQLLENKMSSLLDKVKPNIYKLLLENDLHPGAYTFPGRVTLMDGLMSSQLAAVQAYGVNGFAGMMMTEALHGEQAWRSFDSKREGFTKDDMTIMKEIKTLEGKLKDLGASEKEILENIHLYTSEHLAAQPQFKPEEQKTLVKNNILPLNIELMENGALLFLGSGNHWSSSKRGQEDEAFAISNMFDNKYSEQGLIVRGQSAAGNSFSYDLMKLPTVDGKGINAVMTHKMWHGATEISALANQANRTRENASYIFTADRHHPGAIAEKGKMGILDIGKQPTIPYRKVIGKSASIRGTMVAGYDADGNNGFLSTRYFDDPVIEKISGWEHKKGILSKAHSLIEEGIRDSSIAYEMKRINYLIDKNKEKYKGVEKKLR